MPPLLSLFSRALQPELGFPIYVYGPSGGGKSAVVRGVIDALGARHAILDCITYCTPRSFFESVLTQLHGHTPRASNGYVGWSACESPAAFIAGLQEAICHYERVVLVLENATELEKRKDLRTLLLSLHVFCQSAAITTIFIAEAPWQEAHAACGFSPLCFVRFAGYSKLQLEKILSLDVPSEQPGYADAYRDFLPIFVAYCWEICRDLNELRHLCRITFHHWMQPVRACIAGP